MPGISSLGWYILYGNFANMQNQYFNPFDNINLAPDICFLTGMDLSGQEENISVFPEWILTRFDLREKKFKMMDQFNMVKYGELRLPCCQLAKNAFEELEIEIETAFTRGYNAAKEISSERLFLWMGKIVYGILYNDIKNEIQFQKKFNKEFGLSSKLKERYGLFHLMLQSILNPISYIGALPWSYGIVRLKYSKDVFNFRDNPVNLDFSLGLKGFGIVACLQDNGIVWRNQEGIVKKIGDTELHPVQFEELCARFLYANYLFDHNLKYQFTQDSSGLIIESITGKEEDEIARFAPWDETMFGQVLAGYLQPWGYTTKNISRFPEGVISFLENDFSNEITSPDKIELPF